MAHRPAPAPRRTFLVTAAAAALLAAPGWPGAASTRAAEYAFPPGQEAFHTHEEMVADVDAIASAHPDIVRRFSIGRSYEGRDLVAVKISDNAAVDEAEPEVLFDGLHHGDEHMSLEMTLAILHWLADGYGTDDRVHSLVNSREVFIVFAVNPDGATFDIKGARYRDWRRNRQPTAGTTAVGTDLNRNYDYRWGCCGGSSGDPRSSRFRGPNAFSAPESRALADFVDSRVIDGRQQIRTAISFHTTGRLVMWPYGHTTADVPSGMTTEDHASFVALGTAMAASNGYRPIQASDLYATSGTSRDWLYARHRIFAFTFELSPDRTPYPDASTIPAETGRNRDAVLHLLAQADCPYRAIGLEAERCGAFDDDLEISRSWTVDSLGTDDAVRGRWQRADPKPTRDHGRKQLGRTPSGSKAFVTGAAAGPRAAANDLDGGRTSVDSPAIALPVQLGQRLTFRYYLAHRPDATRADEFRVEVVRADGSSVTVLLERGAAADDDARWARASIPLDPWRGETVVLRFSARDGGRASLIEAAFDDVRVTR